MALRPVEVLVDEAVLAAVDRKARSLGLSRSAFVRQLVAEYVRVNDEDGEAAAGQSS